MHFYPMWKREVSILIGATTENPSFEINSALLSRCRVFVLNSLNTDDLKRFDYSCYFQLKKD